jgi:hypothetical protein
MRVALVVTLTVLIALAQRRGWIDLRGRNVGSSGSPFAVFEELFAPQKHAATLIVEAKRETRDQQGSEGDPFVITVRREDR